MCKQVFCLLASRVRNPTLVGPEIKYMKNKTCFHVCNCEFFLKLEYVYNINLSLKNIIKI